MRRIIKLFNQIDLSILLFLVACINYLGFQLYGGEEQYFAFAKEFMDPRWIPHSFTLTHQAGGNLFFEIVAGFLLKYLSFSQLAFFGRIFNFALLAIPMAGILRYFKLSNIESVVLFQLFFLPHQSIFAGEWIFQNLEVKTLAYIFVLYAILYLLKGKIMGFSIFSAIGTLFHFLAGGWFFLIGLIFLATQRTIFRKLVLITSIYFLIVLPFFIYLAKLYFIDNPAVIQGVNTNWVYCYERLPFHLGIFKDWHYFATIHLDGVLISLVCFVLCLFYFPRFKKEGIPTLNTLNIILSTQQFIFIIIALFDRNGVLLKTYPFRTSVLSSLFILIEISLIIKYFLSPHICRLLKQKKLINRKILPARLRFVYTRIANFILLILFVLFFTNEGIETIQGKNTDIKQPSESMVKLMDYCSRNTSENDVFLLLYKDVPCYFNRLARRENFVVWKFTPTDSRTIYEWYQREQWKNKVLGNPGYIDALTKKYTINYIISSHTLRNPKLVPVKSFDNLMLYKVRVSTNQ
jgi:hypothetical protein